MNWRFWRRPLSPAKIEKLAALAANPFAQPEVRMQKLERLLEEGTAAALEGALGRFAANAQGQIADEEEKAWLVDAVVAAGPVAIGPLKTYIRRGKKLAHALVALRRLEGDPAAAAFFAAHLEALGPEDHRAGEAKRELVDALVESTPAATRGPPLAPFLLDHSDDVRWAVLEAIDASLGEVPGGTLPDGWEAALKGPLVALVTEPAVSARVARRAARLLAARGWRWVAGCTLAPALGGAWRLDAAGALVALA